MRIRDEQPTDLTQIRGLLDAAFPDGPVGQLVDDLREAGDLKFPPPAFEALP